eukprot:925621-Rhodomonas_salina.1
MSGGGARCFDAERREEEDASRAQGWRSDCSVALWHRSKVFRYGIGCRCLALTSGQSTRWVPSKLTAPSTLPMTDAL